MSSVIRIILILILVWYLVRIIDRHIIPALFGSSRKEKTAPGPGKKEFRKSTKQGDVTITDYGKRSKDVKPGDEDYVDYEEVE
jgi:hypothetical protein